MLYCCVAFLFYFCSFFFMFAQLNNFDLISLLMCVLFFFLYIHIFSVAIVTHIAIYFSLTGPQLIIPKKIRFFFFAPGPWQARPLDNGKIFALVKNRLSRAILSAKVRFEHEPNVAEGDVKELVLIKTPREKKNDFPPGN